jgi:hypothetical protein
LHTINLGMTEQKHKNGVDQTILAITDFSKSSSNAILFAANLLQYCNLKFIFLNVFDIPSDKDSLLISIEDILTTESETDLKKQSAEIALAFKNREINISTYSLTGKLKKGIAKIIESEDIDLIVAGIPANKYPSNYLNDCPILFRGQSKYPVLLVPENCVDKPLRRVLTLNFDSAKQQNMLNKDLEHIINHDHITKYTISINEKKIDHKVISSLHTLLKKEKVELIIFISAPGDRIDKAMLDYQLYELYPYLMSLLDS